MDKVKIALEGLEYNYTPEHGWRRKSTSPVFEHDTLKTIATKVADFLESQSISAPKAWIQNHLLEWNCYRLNS